MKVWKRVFAWLALCVLCGHVESFAADHGNFSMTPRTNNGEKWRIGYYEGGEYVDYQKTLLATVKGLMELGWMETAAIPSPEGEQTKGTWEWLATRAKSDYIEFVKDAHYSANFDDELRGETAAAIIKRLSTKKDIDLMIAMGTWAGKDLANNQHHTATMVLTASDPIAAGIVKSVEDSGFDHVQAHVDPFRYERQVRIFHDLVGFKKLGVAYEDTVDGRSYAALDLIEKVAAERGFEIVRCFTKSDIADQEIAGESVKKCFEELARKADAIYVTLQGGVNSRTIPDLAKIVNSNHIPSFSQSGSEEVKQGFLASISRAGFKYVGKFHAESIAKLFNGAKAGRLDQLFEEPPRLAINIKTAVAIGFDPPADFLLSADEIFKE